MKPLGMSHGVGRYVAAENDIVVGTRKAFAGEGKPLIYCHGAEANAPLVWSDPEERNLVRQLAQHFTVGVADLANAVFGNDTGRLRVEQNRTYLAGAPWHADDPVVLVGGSMGAITALGYLKEYGPTNVAALILYIPALDIADVYEMTQVPGTVPPLIDAAYGGTYDDEVHGPDYSPVQFASDLDPDIPIYLYYGGVDPVARPETVEAFVDARPQTVAESLGPYGHTQVAITVATGPVVETARLYL